MRYLLVATGLIASACAAFGAELELPTLRGGSDAFVPAAPVVSWRWDGFYFGGQAGYGIASHNFDTTTQDLVAHELRQLALERVAHVSTWDVLGKGDTRSQSYGGFFGYNIGWEGVIMGLEFNFSRTNFFKDAPTTPISIRTAAGGNTYDVTLTGSASIHITDMATLRARAGFEYGNFLPYAMIGVAAGRADVARSATVSGLQNPTPPPNPNSCDPLATPPCVPFIFTETDSRSGAFIYGWAIGGGLEMMLMPNVFVRGEYEYVGFAPIWGIKTAVNTARVGLGFKFW
jgi:opacity protein-like surface antigen